MIKIDFFYKKIIIYFGLIPLLITGCSNTNKGGITIPQISNNEAKIVEPELKPKDGQIILRLAENHPESHPDTVGDKVFARLVEERTNGRIKIIVYDEGILGDEKSVVEQVQYGGIDFARVNCAPLADIDPKLNILSLPFLFRDSQHLWKVLDGDIGQQLLVTLIPENIIGLAYYDSGARSFYTKKMVKSVSDFKGMKIRVQQSKIYTDLISALGAIPVPMPFGDVYTSIQMNEVDGAENNWSSYLSTKHYELAKYFLIDEHTRTPEIVIANKRVMENLSKEDQLLIKNACKDSAAIQRETAITSEMKAKEYLVQNGIIITELGLNEKKEFDKAVSSIYNTYGKDNKDIIKKIRETQ